PQQELGNHQPDKADHDQAEPDADHRRNVSRQEHLLQQPHQPAHRQSDDAHESHQTEHNPHAHIYASSSVVNTSTTSGAPPGTALGDTSPAPDRARPTGRPEPTARTASLLLPAQLAVEVVTGVVREEVMVRHRRDHPDVLRLLRHGLRRVVGVRSSLLRTSDAKRAAAHSSSPPSPSTVVARTTGTSLRNGNGPCRNTLEKNDPFESASQNS